MSYRELEETVGGLPWDLKEQILGYARSVDEVLPEIFKDAGRPFNRALSNQIIFLAGLRKLHSIVASNYWALDNSATMLKTFQVSKIRAGSLDLSRDGEFHAQLGALLKALESALEKTDIRQYLGADFATLVTVLSSNEHP